MINQFIILQKKTNPKVKKFLYSNQSSKVKMQKDSSINIKKLKKIINFKF